MKPATRYDVTFWACLILSYVADGWFGIFWLLLALVVLLLDYNSDRKKRADASD